MRALGIEVTGSSIHWIILDGSQKSGSIELLDNSTYALPVAYAEPIENLLAMKKVIQDTVVSKKTEKIGIIKADKSASVNRIKIECIIEQAAYECKLPLKLIAPQTIAAIQKRIFLKKVGSTIEIAFNGGKPIEPKYLLKAVFCAWNLMDD